MGRQEAGWVKLHRKILDSDIGRNFLLLGLWTTLLKWANWKDSKIKWRGKPRTLERGELLTSVKELADYGEADRKTVQKWLNYLEIRGSILQEKAPRGSRDGLIIKIINYEKYNSLDALWSHEHGHEAGNEHGNEHGHEGPTYKEYKNKRSSRDRANAPEPRKRARFDAKSLDEVLERLPKETLTHWHQVYPDKEFRDRVLKKAFHYYDQVKPRKKPKTVQGWSGKLGYWLDKDWGKGSDAQPKLPKVVDL